MHFQLSFIKDKHKIGWTQFASSILLAVGGSFWAIILLFQPLDTHKWWAFSFVSLIPSIGRLILAIIGLTIWTIPLFVHPNSFLRQKSSKSFKKGKFYTWTVSIFIFAISLSTFWIYRERTIWGDGLQIVAILEGRDMLWLDPLNWNWHEPLTWLVTVGWYQVCSTFGFQEGIPIVQSLNAFLGATTTVILWHFAHNLMGPQRRKGLLLFLFALSAGAVQILFGHVENYTLVTLTSLIALNFLLKDAQDIELSQLLWGSLFSGITIAAHVTSVFIVSVPLSYQILVKIKRKQWTDITLAIILLLIPLFTTYLLVLAIADVNLLHLFNQETSFQSAKQIISSHNLLNGLNTLILTGLPAILAFVLGVVNFHNWFKEATRYKIQFPLFVITLSTFFVFQSTIPRSIDWDVYAPFAFVLTLLAGGWLLGKTQNLLNITIPVLILSLTFSIPWVWTNAHFTRVWPDSLAPHRDSPFVYYDLIKLFPTATVTSPNQPLCKEEKPECEYVTITTFGFDTPIGFSSHPTIFAHPPASISYHLELPDYPTFFWAMPSLDPMARDWPGDGVVFTASATGQNCGPIKKTIYVNKSQQGWQQFILDLTPCAGHEINLTLTTDPGPNQDYSGDRAGWGTPKIIKGIFSGFYLDLWQ